MWWYCLGFYWLLAFKFRRTEFFKKKQYFKFGILITCSEVEFCGLELFHCSLNCQTACHSYCSCLCFAVNTKLLMFTWFLASQLRFVCRQTAFSKFTFKVSRNYDTFQPHDLIKESGLGIMIGISNMNILKGRWACLRLEQALMLDSGSEADHFWWLTQIIWIDRVIEELITVILKIRLPSKKTLDSLDKRLYEMLNFMRLISYLLRWKAQNIGIFVGPRFQNKWTCVAAEILAVLLQTIRDWEDTILFYIALTPMTVVSLLD